MDSGPPPTEANEATTSALPHLKDYLRVVMARRWLTVSVFLLVVAVAALWTFTRRPRYESKVLLLIEPAKVNVAQIGGMYDPVGVLGPLSSQTFYDTQYRLILARPVLRKTFEHFGLGKTKLFATSADPIEAFRLRFRVTPVKRSRLLWVSYEGTDPERCARVVDYLVRQYMTSYRERSLGVTKGGLEALRRKAAELRPKIEVKSEEIQRFKVKHGVVSFERSRNTAFERLQAINTQLGEAERDETRLRSAFEGIKSAIERRQRLEELPEVLASAAIRQLKLEQVRARKELNGLLGRFGEAHPQVKAARASLQTIDERILDEMRNAYAGTRTELARVQGQVASLRLQKGEQELQVQRYNELRDGYSVMDASLRSLNKNYDAILNRIEEIEIALTAGSKSDNIFVINNARVPTDPCFPRKPRDLALAAILGLALGIGLCFLLDYLDTTIKTKAEIEALFRAPAIGFVPGLSGTDAAGENGAMELISMRRPRSAAAESFRSIRTALAFSTADHPPDCILVTSCSPREGKTVTSVNLAITFAMAGRKTVLVDGDMRKPRIHKVFGVDSQPGLSNWLAGQGASCAAEVAREVDGVDGLRVIPSGPLPPNPAELLASQRTAEVIASLRDEYELVVIDSPPVVNVTDAVILSRLVEGVVVVVRAFSTQRGLAARGAETIRLSGARILGVVQNNADVPRGGYYGYGSYYYYHQHYYYYGEDDPSDGDGRRRRSR